MTTTMSNVQPLPDEGYLANETGIGKPLVSFSPPSEAWVLLDGHFTSSQLELVLADLKRRQAHTTPA